MAAGLIVAAGLVGLFFPSSWLHAQPRGDVDGIETAVIFGFGFERDGDGEISAGAANEFLVDWTLEQYRSLTTAFVQEGGWAAVCPIAERACEIDGVALRRIDLHRDDLDLHTLDIAACAIERLQQFDIGEAVIVAHDLQLARAVENVERVAGAGLCPDCSFAVADVPDVPFPAQTEQWRTGSQFVYRYSEVAARLRFSPWLVRDPPQTCRSPIPVGE